MSDLVRQSDPTVPTIMIGLNMPRVNGVLQTPTWADGSPLDFGGNIAGGVCKFLYFLNFFKFLDCPMG